MYNIIVRIVAKKVKRNNMRSKAFGSDRRRNLGVVAEIRNNPSFTW